MTGAVELPQEASPLTTQSLFYVLQLAASYTTQQQIQTATQQLQNWESHKGYYVLLQNVFVEKSLPREIRYLAIIQLKNGIDKYWRKTAANAVSKEDKTSIRSRLLGSGINEAEPLLALQNALVIAKIVRFEFPHDWPDAITSVTDILRSSTQPNSNPLYLPRALLLLLYIIKELATGRLQRTRASLQSVTPEIFHVLGRIYVEKVQKWRKFIESGGDDEGGALDSIDQSLLAVKVIRRLLIAGYEFPNRNKDVQEFWTIIRSQFGHLLSIVQQDPQTLSTSICDTLEKHLMQLSKLHLEMAKVHPAAFALLPDSVGLVRAYWGLIATFGETYGTTNAVTASDMGGYGDADEEEKSLRERLSLKGFLLIRACVKMVFSPSQTFKYRHAEEKEEQKVSTRLMKTQLLTADTVNHIMETIVTRFFVFRASDLRQWEEEPEEWEKEDEGEVDGWEFSLRPCAEKLFLDLVINFKDLLVPPLLHVFQSVSSPDSDKILFKDSVYTAIGLSASVIHSQLDFDAFLNTTLVAEVQKQDPGCKILRRRIAILLGQWVTVKISGPNRSLVYQIFQHLLNPNDRTNDQVVRVTAGRHFKHIADEWEFDAGPFMPYAPDILDRVMSLIVEVELTETKLALLNTVSVIVERLEHQISPFSDAIVSLLPLLWTQSGEEHLMKQAILTILTRLINSMKDESKKYHGMVLPLIKDSVQPGSEMQVYLLEDALDLWAAILVQTSAPASADILSLAPHLFSTFELGTENLHKALDITQSYYLLAPQEMLEDEMRNRLMAALTSLLGILKPDANGVVTHLMEVIVRAAERLGGEQAIEVIGTGLIESGFLSKVVEGLRGSWEAHQTTGPNRKYPSVDGVVETDYLSVLARFALASPSKFIIALDAMGSVRGESFEQIVEWMLTEWFSHFQNVGDPNKRKLMCLALTRLLETGQKWILQRLQDLMTVWTDVVTELKEGAEDIGGDSLVYWDPEGLKPTDPEAPEDERRRNLTFSDPVHTINTMGFIKHHLHQVIAHSGGQDAFQRDWLVHVDQDVINSYGKLGIW
ncbi:MAG: hypothetical protein M1827_003796 [Pycnora praestabilis]|nr:MAG: hypothetical protein M1827_003796 [Pycnora praestabilis]